MSCTVHPTAPFTASGRASSSSVVPTWACRGARCAPQAFRRRRLSAAVPSGARPGAIVTSRPMRGRVASASPDAAGIHQPGYTLIVHSKSQFEDCLSAFPDKLIVAMCKSTHCRPCKNFMPQYYQLAERFTDYVLLEVTGDESPELRAMMKTWKVKTTPTFIMFRNGVEVHRVSGTRDNKVPDAFLSQLRDDEAGRDWSEVTQEEFSP